MYPRTFPFSVPRLAKNRFQRHFPTSKDRFLPTQQTTSRRHVHISHDLTCCPGLVQIAHELTCWPGLVQISHDLTWWPGLVQIAHELTCWPGLVQISHDLTCWPGLVQTFCMTRHVGRDTCKFLRTWTCWPGLVQAVGEVRPT